MLSYGTCAAENIDGLSAPYVASPASRPNPGLPVNAIVELPTNAAGPALPNDHGYCMYAADSAPLLEGAKGGGAWNTANCADDGILSVLVLTTANGLNGWSGLPNGFSCGAKDTSGNGQSP